MTAEEEYDIIVSQYGGSWLDPHLRKSPLTTCGKTSQENKAYLPYLRNAYLEPCFAGTASCALIVKRTLPENGFPDQKWNICSISVG